MPLANDLLEQAIHLSTREGVGAPRQASLRRAVSAAYYALFHLLGSEAASLAAPPSPPKLRGRVQRALNHGEMKAACNGLQPGKANAVFIGMVGQPSPHLVSVASAFIELQQARHTADYDVSVKYSRTEVQLLLQQCAAAFTAWNTIHDTDEASVFLASLLSHQRWNR